MGGTAKKNRGAVGLRRAETLVCKFALGMLDPQDSSMEHEGTPERQTTWIHLGNSAGNILHLEKS